MKKIWIKFEIKYSETQYSIPEKVKLAIERAIQNSWECRGIEIPMVTLEVETTY